MHLKHITVIHLEIHGTWTTSLKVKALKTQINWKEKHRTNTNTNTLILGTIHGNKILINAKCQDRSNHQPLTASWITPLTHIRSCTVAIVVQPHHEDLPAYSHVSAETLNILSVTLVRFPPQYLSKPRHLLLLVAREPRPPPPQWPHQLQWLWVVATLRAKRLWNRNYIQSTTIPCFSSALSFQSRAFAVKVAVTTTACTEERVLRPCFLILVAAIVGSSSYGHCMVAATLLVPKLYFQVRGSELGGVSTGVDAWHGDGVLGFGVWRDERVRYRLMYEWWFVFMLL